MLADAAVVGKVFWAGAVVAMGDRNVTVVTDALREPLGRPVEALPVLRRAREVFARLGAAPALAETEALFDALG